MESSSRTLVCSVLFLDIVEYSKKAVADQLSLKQAFNQVLASALEQVAQRDRIILDTGDGAAVTFMGDPEDALFAAMAVRDETGSLPQATAALPIRLGINLGPVRLVKDLNGQMNIIGDGINVAQRVMSFARPGQLLVSRSFYEVVSCLSRDYMNLFRHEGSRTDKHVREHEVYSVGGAPPAKRVSHTAAQAAGGGLKGWLAGTGPFGLRRTALVAAPVLFFAFFGGSLAINSMTTPAAAPPAPPVAQPAPPPRIERPKLANASELARPSAAAAGAEKITPQQKKIAERIERKVLQAKAERERAAASPVAAAAPPRAPEAAPPAEGGRMVVAVAPWGEVFVDGRSRGVSPPMQFLDLPAGAHTVEIRNGDFPPHVERIVIKPGEPVRIRHRFK